MTRLARFLLAACVLSLVFVPDAGAQADVHFDPAGGLSFGTFEVGEEAIGEVWVVNNGDEDATIGASSLSGNAAFAIDYDGCEGLALPPDTYCVLDITFAPGVKGPTAAQLTTQSDAPGAPHVMWIDGVGKLPAFWVEPLDLGTVKGTYGTQIRVTLSQPGTQVAASVGGVDAAAFILEGPCVSENSYQCVLPLTFAALRPGPHQATLMVVGGGETKTVALSATYAPSQIVKPPFKGPTTPSFPPRHVEAPATPDEQNATVSKQAVTRALSAAIGKWTKRGREGIRKDALFGMRLPASFSSGSVELVVRTADKRQRTFAKGYATGTKRLWATVTRVGKRLLAADGKRRLRAALSFAPDAGRAVVVARTFTLPG